MTLNKIFENINQSSAESWRYFEGLEEEYHTKLVYKNDIALEICYGKVLNDDYREGWANEWFNPKAEETALKILYNNKVIYQDSIIKVDGGRVSVLIPEIPNVYTITEDGLDREHLAEIISNFETYGSATLQDAITKFKNWLKKLNIGK